MALLKTLFNRFRPQGPAGATDTTDRYRQLETLQQHHSFIEVKFPRLQQTFQSLILELHADDGYVLLDELYPPAGRQELVEGDSAEISGRDRGVNVTFFSRLLLREIIDDVPAYRMELPEEIGVSRRRSAYRIYVEREADLLVDIRLDEQAPLDAGIVNLSSDGIKLTVSGDISERLAQRRLWENCLIRLPGPVDVDCDIEVRNAYVMRSPYLHTLVGAKLHIAQPPQRGKLDQYLAAVQRKQRRRELRLS